MGHGVDIIEQIANKKGLFRERDVEAEDVSSSCLDDARAFFIVKSHGHGVWSHYKYNPTRYELVQIRLERAVFWGPSALWLLGVTTKEPEALWIALSNKSRRPRTLALDSVVVRTRNLERGVVTIYQPNTLTEFRVHSRERAEADVAGNDLSALLARAIRPRRFQLARCGELLSSQLRTWPGWTRAPGPPPGYEAPDREEWAVASSLSPAQESRK